MSESLAPVVPRLYVFRGKPLPIRTWTAYEPGAEPPEGSALDLPNSVQPEVLAPILPRFAVIRLHFPAFGDGRAYSQARRLRVLGYRGRLRATGKAVVLDQALELRAAGFDEVELRDDQRPENWAALLARHADSGFFSADRGALVNRRGSML